MGNAVEIRIRFGCPAQPRQQGRFEVRFDEEQRTLRLRAAPDLTLDDPNIAALAASGFEAVEGFWLARPWILADGCPALPSPSQLAPADAEAAADTPPAAVAPAATQRIGIARFFTETDFRTGRRDRRPYEAVSVLAADKQPSAEGYDLVLAGRLRQVPGGRVIACRPDQRRMHRPTASSPPTSTTSGSNTRARATSSPIGAAERR